MTTTASFSKERFLRLTRLLLRRNRGLGFYLTALLVFFLPVQYVLTAMRLLDRGPLTANLVRSNFYSPSGLLPAVASIMVPFILIVGALVISLSQVNYMHSRRAVDLYHSLPVTRVELMCSQAAAALVTLWIPLILSYLLTFVCALLLRGTLGPLLPILPVQALIDVLGWMITQFVIVAIALLASSQVGTVFDSFLFTGELLGAPTLVLLVSNWVFEAWLRGYVSPPLFEKLCLRSSVLIAMPYRYLSSGNPLQPNVSVLTESNWMLAGWAVAGAAIFALALWAYRRRPSERAEATPEQSLLVVLGKVLGVYIGAVAVGFLISTIAGGSELSFAFGCAAGGALVFLLIEGVLGRGFRGVARALPAGALMVAAVTCLAVIVVGGGLGYETRIPAPEQVQGVTLTYAGRYSDISRLLWENVTYETNSYSYSDRPYVYYYDDQTLTLASPAAVSLVTELHASVLATDENNANAPYRLNRNLRLRYDLTGGDTLARYYRSNSASETTAALCNRLEALPEVIEKTHPAFALRGSDLQSVTVMNRDGLLKKELVGAAELETLLTAVRADALRENVPASIAGKNEIVGYLYFDTGLNDRRLAQPLERDGFFPFPLPLYAEAAETRRALEQLDASEVLTGASPAVTELALMVWYGDKYAYDFYGDAREYPKSDRVSDPARLAELLALAEPIDPLAAPAYPYRRGSNCFLSARLIAGENQGMAVSFPTEKLPDWALAKYPELNDYKEYGVDDAIYPVPTAAEVQPV